jgi:acyl carrier protein
MIDQIREFVVHELLDGKPVSDDEDLLISGLVDSLGVMRLVGFLEDALSTSIPPEDVTIENFANIAVVASYIRQRVNSAADAAADCSGATQ